MAMAFFRQHFTDSHPGHMAGTQLLTHVIELRQEPDLTEESRAQLKDISILTAKKRHVSVLMSGRADITAYYAATLLADRTDQPVCFVTCPQWVEHYIGETEKNLARLFSEAQSRHWILFFDEADALFGKRTSVNDSHDRYSSTKLDRAFLAKLLSAHQELVIFSIKEQQYTDKIAQLFSHHLHFD
ncbi:AAA family ATPase [Neptunicella sp. SCSIO 80796]|uniref:AAA family ATPase n=1 Tax=Neptunicella plasticusilytica TaxID=3117012 RepID=UPI003A4DEB73